MFNNKNNIKIMEKAEKILINVMVILFLTMIIGGSIYWEEPKERYYTPIEEEIVIEEEIREDDNWVIVTATVYNPTEDQCDSDPLITADNNYIDLDLLKEKKIKWIAVSRDLRKDFKYGDEVMIECDHDPSINGIYEVRDTMNPRWKNRIDLLRHEEEDLGMWEGVRMKKLERL